MLVSGLVRSGLAVSSLMLGLSGSGFLVTGVYGLPVSFSGGFLVSGGLTLTGGLMVTGCLDGGVKFGRLDVLVNEIDGFE